MYRIMAKKLHPDKFSSYEKTPEVIEKIEAFKLGTAAYDKKNWAAFLDICEKYDILPTRYEKINSLRRNEISDIGKRVNNKKLSFSWRLYECEDDDDCKDEVIKNTTTTVAPISPPSPKEIIPNKTADTAPSKVSQFNR